jgi:uncharacterized UPF0160 family protein
MWKRTVIVTHSGNFHPDDSFAVASLRLLLKKPVKVRRSRDPEVWKTGDYVVDVGGEYDPVTRRFDHHQIGGAGARENGIPYAAFGLVWKTYGTQIAGSTEAAEAIDKKLVAQIDAMDNGTGAFVPVQADAYPYTVGNVILANLPTWKEDRTGTDAKFLDAVAFAEKVLAREIRIAADTLEGRKLVEKLYRESPRKDVVTFDSGYPWHDVLHRFPEALFVVEPAAEDGVTQGWKVRTVHKASHTFENRKDLPASWAGLRDAQLAAVTGVPDALFCHNKRFIAVAKSKEGALALAELALRE